MRPLGFEPRTCGLRVRCSAIELEAQLFDLAPGSISLLKAPGGPTAMLPQTWSSFTQVG